MPPELNSATNDITRDTDDDSASNSGHDDDSDVFPNVRDSNVCPNAAMYLFLFGFFLLLVGWFFGPVDARETCFGPCVRVAGAYALPLSYDSDVLPNVRLLKKDAGLYAV